MSFIFTIFLLLVLLHVTVGLISSNNILSSLFIGTFITLILKTSVSK